MSYPLLEIKGLCRQFPSGEQTITVLKDIDLTIEAGEMLAIIGASGSGKSTLMNILGCLDQPTQGTYRVAGRPTDQLNADELAELRREHFGFIFQRYHLLSDLTALGNVEIPAIYAGKERSMRRARASALLQRLGLADRQHHRPGQLSGGQQQRVSIARALMNGGQVILADEPTGALDSHSGKEVMDILKALHAEGHTVIIVTHDVQVAQHAQRIIELKDGEIIADRKQATGTSPQGQLAPGPTHSTGNGWHAAAGRLTEALHMSLLAMNAHRLRTFLTMLGIIIGIASVVSVVASGEGSRQRVMKNISSLGTNTVDIFPGKDFGDMQWDAIRSLVPADVDALAEQDFVDSVTPSISAATTLRHGNTSLSAQLYGVGEQYFRVRGMTMAQGKSFNQDSVLYRAQVAVIDTITRDKLFPANLNPIGQVILVGPVPLRVIGVVKKQDNGYSNNNLSVWMPYTTVMTRLTAQHHLSQIIVRVSDDVSSAAAEQGIIKLLTLRHKVKDFFVFNRDTIRTAIEGSNATMTLLVSLIAVISLIVGGIGVMNIMLVSVTERTREIGVRMAVGARQSDIRQQFLIEAVLVCLAGGVLGILLALAFGAIFSRSSSSFEMVYSMTAMVSAFACSTVLGVVFGFLPARNAARLDPIDALARE